MDTNLRIQKNEFEIQYFAPTLSDRYEIRLKTAIKFVYSCLPNF